MNVDITPQITVCNGDRSRIHAIDVTVDNRILHWIIRSVNLQRDSSIEIAVCSDAAGSPDPIQIVGVSSPRMAVAAEFADCDIGNHTVEMSQEFAVERHVRSVNGD